MNLFVFAKAVHEGSQRTAHVKKVPILNSLLKFHGNTTLVFFVATSCKYCAYEGLHVLPTLVKWAKVHKNNIVIVNASDTLGLGKSGLQPQTGKDGPWTPNHDATKIAVEMEKWAQLYHLTPYVYVNPSLNLAKEYHITKIPSGIVLSSKGQFVAKWEGVFPASEIEKVARLANGVN